MADPEVSGEEFCSEGFVCRLDLAAVCAFVCVGVVRFWREGDDFFSCEQEKTRPKE
mgnify:CR=1 FL=1